MTTLKSLVDETANIKNEIVECHSNLSSILTSKNVEVSEEDKMSDLIGKVELFDKHVPSILYLYKEGNEYIDITGGWVAAGQSGTLGKIVIEKGTDYIKFTNNTGNVSYCNGGISHLKAIDFTNYNTLYVEFIDGGYGVSGYSFSLDIFSNRPIGNNDSSVCAYLSSANASKKGIYSLNIATIKGLYYFYIIDRPLGCWSKIKNIWLEK